MRNMGMLINDEISAGGVIFISCSKVESQVICEYNPNTCWLLNELLLCCKINLEFG
jgi:hypothetical protein